MRSDRIVGVALVLVGALLFWRTFSFRELPWEPLGMAFWPRALIVMLGLLALYMIARGSVDNSTSERIDWRAVLALASGVAYILAMPYVGYLLLTPPFILAAVLLLAPAFDGRRLVEAVLTAALGTAGVYFIFHGGLRVQLPQGLLG